MRNFVRILNPAAGESPFTNSNRAVKLCAQGRATMIDGALRLIEHAEIGRLQRERADRAETRLFDRAVAENCKARVWRTVHSGGSRMPGGPQMGVRQFVEIPAMRFEEAAA